MKANNFPPFHTAEPYYPTSKDLIVEKLKLLDLKDGDVVLDLGCGDARALILACKVADVKCIGYEVLPEALKDAEKNINEADLSDRIEIRNEDFTHADLSEANAVILYLTRASLGELSLKLENELNEGVKIVTHEFDLPAWEIKKHVVYNDFAKENDIYLFEK